MLKLDKRMVFAVGCILGLALGIFVYLPGLPGEFIFDDIPSIVNNPSIQLRDLSSYSLVDAMFSSPTGFLLRPLSMLSFALNAYFFGISAFWFKLINIVIHLTCGILLWLVAREVLRANARNGNDSIQVIGLAWVSLTATLWWLVHPLNLTSVLYAVQRETALAALFTAAGMYAYLAGRRRQQEQGKGLLLIWVVTPICALAGILSKETAVLLFVYLWVAEFTLLRFRGGYGGSAGNIHVFFAVFLWVPTACLIVLIFLNPDKLLGAYSGRDFTPYQRILTEGRVIVDYLRWTFIPDIRQLALFHDDFVISEGLLQPYTTILSLIFITLLLIAAIAIRKRLPLLSFAVLWFFAGHVLESTVFPLELAYEHRNYLPIFGLLLGVSGSVYSLAERSGWLRPVAVLGLLTILLFGSATALRASEWGSELEFARAESRHHPASARAQTELFWAYMRYIVTKNVSSLAPQAVAAAERSKAVDRFSINQDVGLAYMYINLKDLPNAKMRLKMAAEGAKDARPSATLQLALQTMIVMATPENKPLYDDMHALLINATTNIKLMKDPCYYATVWNTLGIYNYKTLDIPGSLEAMNKAVMLCPGSPKMRENYASMLLDYGDTKYANQQLIVLRQMHDIRTLSEMRSLEQRYKEALADKTSQMPAEDEK